MKFLIVALLVVFLSPPASAYWSQSSDPKIVIVPRLEQSAGPKDRGAQARKAAAERARANQRKSGE